MGKNYASSFGEQKEVELVSRYEEYVNRILLTFEQT